MYTYMIIIHNMCPFASEVTSKVNYDNGQLSLWLAELHSPSLSLPEPFAIHVSQIQKSYIW